MGMYPRKGAIAVGADADITVLDPAARRTVRKEDLHDSDYTPWEGQQVAAWPRTTVLRGKVMVADGEFLGAPSDGQFIKRRVAEEWRRHGGA
jgi:dihydropyrimidinase